VASWPDQAMGPGYQVATVSRGIEQQMSPQSTGRTLGGLAGCSPTAPPGVGGG